MRPSDSAGDGQHETASPKAAHRAGTLTLGATAPARSPGTAALSPGWQGGTGGLPTIPEKAGSSTQACLTPRMFKYTVGGVLITSGYKNPQGFYLRGR